MLVQSTASHCSIFLNKSHTHKHIPSQSWSVIDPVSTGPDNSKFSGVSFFLTNVDSLTTALMVDFSTSSFSIGSSTVMSVMSATTSVDTGKATWTSALCPSTSAVISPEGVLTASLCRGGQIALFIQGKPTTVIENVLGAVAQTLVFQLPSSSNDSSTSSSSSSSSDSASNEKALDVLNSITSVLISSATADDPAVVIDTDAVKIFAKIASSDNLASSAPSVPGTSVNLPDSIDGLPDNVAMSLVSLQGNPFGSSEDVVGGAVEFSIAQVDGTKIPVANLTEAINITFTLPADKIVPNCESCFFLFCVLCFVCCMCCVVLCVCVCVCVLCVFCVFCVVLCVSVCVCACVLCLLLFYMCPNMFYCLIGDLMLFFF